MLKPIYSTFTIFYFRYASGFTARCPTPVIHILSSVCQHRKQLLLRHRHWEEVNGDIRRLGNVETQKKKVESVRLS